MINLIRRLLRRSPQNIETVSQTNKFTSEMVDDQIGIFSQTDGLPREDIEHLAKFYYCRARLLEETGYEITAKKEEGDIATVRQFNPRLYRMKN